MREGMKKIRFIFLMLTYVATNDSFATPVGNTGVLTDDFTVGYGEHIYFSDARVIMPLTLTNHGYLSGRIYTNPRIELSVKTSRPLNADFILGEDASLTQLISRVGELHQLSVFGGTYRPTIGQNFSGRLTGTDIFQAFENPNIILTVRHEMLALDIYMHDLENMAKRLDIHGAVRLNIMDFDGSALDLSSWNGQIFFGLQHSIDPMFEYISDGTNAKRIRQLDYTKIFGADNAKAAFLNDIRDLNPDDTILRNLDSAETLGQLTDRMNRVMFFNPMALNANLMPLLSRYELRQNLSGPGLHIGAEHEMTEHGGGTRLTLGGANFHAFVHIGDHAEEDEWRYGNARIYIAGAEGHYGAFTLGARAMVADWESVRIFNDGDTDTTAQSVLFHTYIGAEPKLFGGVGLISRLNFIHSRILDIDENMLYGSLGANVDYMTENLGIISRYRLFGLYNQTLSEDFMNAIPRFEYGAEIGYILPNDGLAFAIQISNIRLAINAKMMF